MRTSSNSADILELDVGGRADGAFACFDQTALMQSPSTALLLLFLASLFARSLLSLWQTMLMRAYSWLRNAP